MPIITNISGSIGAYFPTPSPILWVAANTLSLGSGQQVAVLPDISGSGNNLSQSVLAKRPVYLTNQINGLPALSFNGSSDLLACATQSWNSGGSTLFVVTQLANVATGSYQVLIADSTSQVEFAVAPASGHWILEGHTGFISVTSPALTNSTTYVMSGVVNGASSAAYLNGAQAGTGTCAVGGQTGFTMSAASYYVDGLIAEAIVYNAVLSQTQRHQIEGYLAQKYNIPVVQQ